MEVGGALKTAISFDDMKSVESGLTLDRLDYYTVPPLEELKEKHRQGKYVLEQLTIGRNGFGSVYFDGPIIIKDLNLDDIVSITHKEVELYPDETRRPPVGYGLNRPAVVKLDRIWPRDKTTYKTLTSSEFVQKLEKANQDAGAQFLTYIPDTGSWIFKVMHFSKYGLFDSDEEDEDINAKALMNKHPETVKKLPPDAIPASRVQGKKPLSQLQDDDVASANTEFYEPGSVAPAQPSTPLLFPDRTPPIQPASTSFTHPHLQDEFYEDHGNEETSFHPSALSASAVLTMDEECYSRFDVSREKIILMKKSFFPEAEQLDEEHEDIVEIQTSPMGQWRHSRGAHNGDETPKLLKTFPKYLLSVEDSSPRKKNKQGRRHSRISSIDYETDSFQPPVEHDITSALSPMDLEITEKYYSPMYGFNIRQRTDIVNQVRTVTPETNRISTHVYKYRSRALPLHMTTVGQIGAHSIRDMSLFKGYGFRVGWGPKNVCLMLTTQQSASAMNLESSMQHVQKFLSGRRVDDVSGRVVQRIRLRGGSSGIGIQELMGYLEKHLMVQLNNSEFYLEENVPGIRPKPGNESLSSHHSLKYEKPIPGSLQEYSNNVWTLCLSLWGYTPDYEPPENSHRNLMWRKECFSNWLRTVVQPTVVHEVKQILSSDGNRDSINTSAIWTLMTGDEVVEACSLAQTNGDFFLTILLTQMGSSPFVKFLLQEQFDLWKSIDADRFLHRDRIKLLLLLCGIPIFRGEDETINACEGLDWKRALGLHIWFLTSEVQSIKDAFMNYKKAFAPENIIDMYAKPPVPSYLDDDYLVELDDNCKIFDMCYHIIHLYCDRYYPMAQIFDPVTHTTDPFDYRLSWFIFVALYAVGYHHISAEAEAKLHTSFAAQLESYGMWHWSVFVMLHLKKAESRIHGVLKILEGNVDITNEDEDYIKKETFVIEQLKIPEEWIYRIKATRAASQSQFQMAVFYYNKAKEYSSAHQILLEHLAPTYLISEEYAVLRALLKPMISGEETINDWNKGGQIILSYLTVIERITELLSCAGPVDTYELESLEPDIIKLCQQIPAFLETSNLHRLCKNDISKRVFDLIGQFAELDKADKRRYRLLLFMTMKLPMADSFAREEREQILKSIPVHEGLYWLRN